MKTGRDAKLCWRWVLSLILLCSLAYFLFLSHDVYLWQLSRSLTALKHPQHTQRVAVVKDLGLLVANGNHCDYFVAEMRSYSGDLSPDSIEKFYRNSQIWNPLNRRYERVSVGVVENGGIKSDEDWTGTGDFLKDYFKSYLPRKLSNQKLYFVLFLDVGNSTGCDLRCT